MSKIEKVEMKDISLDDLKVLVESLENNEDDSVDWTEGWNGTVTNTYISHTKEGFSTAFEGDKVNNNPKFVNVTAILDILYKNRMIQIHPYMKYLHHHIQHGR